MKGKNKATYNGFLSSPVLSVNCLMNERGVSFVTEIPLSRCFINSTNFFKKETKCSALRMLPGTASCKISAGKMGFPVIAVSS